MAVQNSIVERPALSAPALTTADTAAHRAAPRVRPSRRRPGLDDERRDSINAHFAPGSPHARGECGPVCTFGDW